MRYLGPRERRVGRGGQRRRGLHWGAQRGVNGSTGLFLHSVVGVGGGGGVGGADGPSLATPQWGGITWSGSAWTGWAFQEAAFTATALPIISLVVFWNVLLALHFMKSNFSVVRETPGNSVRTGILKKTLLVMLRKRCTSLWGEQMSKYRKQVVF